MTGAGEPGRRPLRWRWLWPAAAYAALVFLLSSLSNPFPFEPTGLLTLDKLLHFVEYAVLGALLAWGLSRAGMALASGGLWAAVVGSVYGLTDELHQAFVPNRSADARDWLADTAGALAGALAVVAFLRRRGARASIRA
jgi:VanZ family protein